MRSDYNLTDGDTFYASMSASEMLAAGAGVAAVTAMLRGSALAALAEAAEAARRKIDDGSPGKLAEYLAKREIARDPAAADPALLTLFDREGAARGLDRAGHVADVLTTATALNAAILTISAVEKEARAEIAAADAAAPDFEAQLETAVSAGRAALDAALPTLGGA